MHKKSYHEYRFVVSMTAKMSAKKALDGFGMEVEEGKMSGRRLFCPYSEQEKPEPVEMMVLVLGIY